MKFRSPAGLAAGLAAATLLAAPAAAAPVNVQLRIEGPTRTLFEGPVTTDVRPFRFTGDATEHQCDGTTVGGTSPSPVPTRGAALATAAEQTPFSVVGSWHPQYGASFTEIAGESVKFDPGTSRFLAEYKNDVSASFGACSDPIQSGDDLLFAYADGSEKLLELSGPARAQPGQTATVRVTETPSGTPVAGATVGAATTSADGTAVVGPFPRGDNDLKAAKAGTIRSNRLRVCVTDGADGACGTLQPSPPDRTAPVATITGIRNGQQFARRRAPRQLRGTVSPDPSGLWAVKIRLTRRLGTTCWYFSGSRERFLERTCGKRYAFKVGDRSDWSYLLPSRLPRGRYVLDSYAIDKLFNHGVSRTVRFRVR